MSKESEMKRRPEASLSNQVWVRKLEKQMIENERKLGINSGCQNQCLA